MAQKRKGSTQSTGSSIQDPPETGGTHDALEEIEDFDDPESGVARSSQGGDDPESAGIAYSEGTSDSADQQILEAKQRIESFLAGGGGNGSRGGGGFGAFSAGEGATNVVGVGLGSAKVDTDQISPQGPGSLTLNVYVAEPVGQEAVRAALFDSMDVQAASDDSMPVNIVVTGPIDALAHRFRDRPAPGGISIGNFRVNSAGTLGCLARGRTSPRNSRILLLSNNHVIALSNAGQANDPILQPGRLDGGTNPADRIAILERFVTIQFGGPANYVDCATGWCWSGLVRPDLVYLAGTARRYFRVSSAPRLCQVGMIVGKSGRTTQLKSGRVTDCSATIQVNYGGGRVALFRDQIAIVGTSAQFSAPGDSGSLIWTWDAQRNPVGLLFAGGNNVTFGNKIGRVLAALDINLYT